MTGIGKRLHDTITGARAGLVATAAMSLLMLAARRAGLTGRLPPRAIADRASAELPPGEQPTEEQRDVLAIAAHFGFGAALGALFGLATSGLRRMWLSTALGTAYGVAVYLVSYQGWLPALDVLPPATRDRPGRTLTMVVGHLVFGSTLGALAGLMERRDERAAAARRLR